MVEVSDDDYAQLLALRTGLRRFLRWSEDQAKSAGLTPAQHQLLLAVRGHDDPRGPTIGEVADYLLLLHHSAVELVDRAHAAGLVKRRRDPDDHRVVRLALTRKGADRLEALTALTLEELDRLAHSLPEIWKGLAPTRRRGPVGRPETRGAAVDVVVARAYDDLDPVAAGTRVLVDRLWPRGLTQAHAPVDVWMKDVAPSTGLRRWYGHEPSRFDEFARRYRLELTGGPARESLGELRKLATDGEGSRTPRLTLVTATKDVGRSGAAVLREVLAGR